MNQGPLLRIYYFYVLITLSFGGWDAAASGRWVWTTIFVLIYIPAVALLPVFPT